MTWIFSPGAADAVAADASHGFACRHGGVGQEWALKRAPHWSRSRAAGIARQGPLWCALAHRRAGHSARSSPRCPPSNPFWQTAPRSAQQGLQSASARRGTALVAESARRI